MHRLKKPIWTFAAEAGGEGGEGGAEGSGGTTDPGGEGKSDQTFTQADLDRIVKERVQRERTKFADYDDLKAKAEGAKTAEERIAALESEIATSKVEALRARYGADVPEKLRPLLTGTTDEELKAQRDLILDGESERKKQGNRAPDEGRTPTAKAGDERTIVRSLFGSGG